MIIATMSSATLTGVCPIPPVVAVMAGRTAAAFTVCTLPATSSPDISEKTGRSREAALAELVASNPQGRLITPEEVAETVRWLCGADARGITGQSIAVAGGEVM